MSKFLNGKVLMIFGVVCIALYGLFNLLMPEKSLDNLSREERLSLKRNIVVLGVDGRPADNDSGRSDTLFVVMFDEGKKSVSLLSIPRDTRVSIPEHGWDKINHAYAYGGRELTQQTVEEFLGIRIDNYIMVDFSGFKGLVDAIGGVDLVVEKDMYYYDHWDGFTVNLKKGPQHLDGEAAIQYVRYRDEEGDIGRIKRQQHFMMAMYDKITSADMLLHVPGLTKQLTSMIKTNLPVTDMLEIGKALHSMVTSSGLVMNTVPGTPQYIDGVSYWLPDITELRSKIVAMQGAEMSAHYKEAAEIMEAEYKKAVEDALEKEKEASEEKEDKSKVEDEEQDKDKKDTAKKNKEKAAKKRKAAKENALDEDKKVQAEETKSVAERGDSLVVRLVNCSGDKNAAGAAAAKLQSAGFTVVSGGSGEVIEHTTVISTTNNGAVVNKLSNVPFTHKMRITRDGAADCAGVIMLGKDFI